jgi:[acyl-carrier-protein] S-malonyltransferase
VSDAFLFPGQGSETPGMGGGALRRPGPVRALLERASSLVGVDLAEVVARGDQRLTRTELSQPALVAVGLGLALEARAAGLEPAAVAGHSVGELTAFAFAGCLEPEEAVDCVVARARFMAEAAKISPGAMAAVRLPGGRDLEDVLALGRQVGHLEVAAHNGPEEWVLTGEPHALSNVATRYATVPLKVGGAWHSRTMAEAASRWREVLQRVSFRRPTLPLVANSTGQWIGAHDDLSELLLGQLTRPVLWAESLRTMAEAGVSTLHVFAPGRVLRGLCRANLGQLARIELHEGLAERSAA